MLDNLFLQILNMSFIASFVIVFVLVIRFFLKKVPKVFSYVLWVVALFRLVCPFSFESIFSLIPEKTKSIPNEIIYSTPEINTKITGINNVVNSSLTTAGTSQNSVDSIQIWVFIGELVWLTGKVR
ncbi:MAG: M56 family metallopeptidase [Eubacteriales bacterium]